MYGKHGIRLFSKWGTYVGNLPWMEFAELEVALGDSESWVVSGKGLGHYCTLL